MHAHAHSHNISGLQTNGAESGYGLTFAVVKCQKKVNYSALLGFPTVYMCTAWLETHTCAQHVLLQLDRNQDPPPSVSQPWRE